LGEERIYLFLSLIFVFFLWWSPPFFFPRPPVKPGVPPPFLGNSSPRAFPRCRLFPGFFPRSPPVSPRPFHVDRGLFPPPPLTHLPARTCPTRSLISFSIFFFDPFPGPAISGFPRILTHTSTSGSDYPIFFFQIPQTFFPPSSFHTRCFCVVPLLRVLPRSFATTFVPSVPTFVLPSFLAFLFFPLSFSVGDPLSVNRLFPHESPQNPPPPTPPWPPSPAHPSSFFAPLYLHQSTALHNPRPLWKLRLRFCSLSSNFPPILPPTLNFPFLWATSSFGPKFFPPLSVARSLFPAPTPPSSQPLFQGFPPNSRL